MLSVDRDARDEDSTSTKIIAVKNLLEFEVLGILDRYRDKSKTVTSSDK
jgi:hypothetical protein